MAEGIVARPSDGSPERMRLYLQYDGYLTARQLSKVISGIDELYEVFSSGAALAALRLQRADRSRLRLEQVHTGNSITLTFLSGLPQAIQDVNTGATILAGGGTALLASARALIATYRQVNQARQEKELGQEAVRSAQIRSESERLNAQAKAVTVRDLQSRAEFNEQIRLAVLAGGIPVERVEGLVEQALRPINTLDAAFRSSTISHVSIDGQTLIGRAPRESAGEASPDATSATSEPSD